MNKKSLKKILIEFM